jgi:hypothetical protein
MDHRSGDSHERHDVRYDYDYKTINLPYQTSTSARGFPSAGFYGRHIWQSSLRIKGPFSIFSGCCALITASQGIAVYFP